MPATSYFFSDFTGATDPALTPDPFTTTTISGSNSMVYTSSGGVDGGPGASLSFAGTTGVAYGQNVFASTAPSGSGVLRVKISVNYSVIPFAGLSGNTMVHARVENGTNAVLFIQLFKSSAANAVFRLVDVEHSVTVAGTTVISAGAYYEVCAELNMNAGSESATLYVNGVQEAQSTGLAAFTRTSTKASFGSYSTSTVPAAGAAFAMDNVSVSVVSGQAGGGLRPMGAAMPIASARFPGGFF